MFLKKVKKQKNLQLKKLRKAKQELLKMQIKIHLLLQQRKKKRKKRRKKILQRMPMRLLKMLQMRLKRLNKRPWVKKLMITYMEHLKKRKNLKKIKNLMLLLQMEEKPSERE